MTNLISKIKRKDSNQPPVSPSQFSIPDVWVTPPEDENSYDNENTYIAHRSSTISSASTNTSNNQMINFNNHSNNSINSATNNIISNNEEDDMKVKVDIIRNQSQFRTFEDLPSDEEDDVGNNRVYNDDSMIDLLKQRQNQFPLPTSSQTSSPKQSKIKLKIDTDVSTTNTDNNHTINNVSSNILTTSTSSSFSPDTPTFNKDVIPTSNSKTSLNTSNNSKKSLRKRISTHFSKQPSPKININDISTPSPKLPPLAHINTNTKNHNNNHKSQLIVEQVRIRSQQLESLGFDGRVFDSEAILNALGHNDNQDEIVGIAT